MVFRSRLVAAMIRTSRRWFFTPQPFHRDRSAGPVKNLTWPGGAVPRFHQKQGSPVGLFKFAGMALGRPGKRAFFISEQFAVNQGVWDGAAVDFNKGGVCPGRYFLDRRLQSFLSRSGFT